MAQWPVLPHRPVTVGSRPVMFFWQHRAWWSRRPATTVSLAFKFCLFMIEKSISQDPVLPFTHTSPAQFPTPTQPNLGHVHLDIASQNPAAHLHHRTTTTPD